MIRDVTKENRSARRTAIRIPRRVPSANEQPTLTVEEAGKFLLLSRGSAYKAARRGEIPTIRIGRSLIVPTAQLRQMLGLDPAA